MKEREQKAIDEDVEIIALCKKGNIDAFEISTLYYGQSGTLAQAEGLAELIAVSCPGLEIEIHNGQQRSSNYIISLE